MATRREGRRNSAAAKTRWLSSRPVRLLEALAQADSDLSTPQLAAALGEGIEQQQALSKYGAILRGHAAAGHVKRTGETPGTYQCPPAALWRITSAGRTWLRNCHTEAEQATNAFAAEQSESVKAAENRALLEAAGRALGRSAPVSERRRIAQELRYLGCSFAEIGDMFGVSGETIRLDLLPGRG